MLILITMKGSGYNVTESQLKPKPAAELQTIYDQAVMRTGDAALL